MKYKALLLICFVAMSARAELPSLKPNNPEVFNNLSKEAKEKRNKIADDLIRAYKDQVK